MSGRAARARWIAHGRRSKGTTGFCATCGRFSRQCWWSHCAHCRERVGGDPLVRCRFLERCEAGLH